MNSTEIRWQVFFRGTVQGVGFRYQTCRIARAMNIGGWVRNLPDGSVEMIAEGTMPQLKELVEQISHSCGSVSDVEINQQVWVGEFAGFEVRY